MVVKIVLLLALGALTYQVVYVLPKKVSRTILVVGTLLTLFVLSATTPWKATNKVMLSWLALFLQSLQLVAIAGFMTQVSQYITQVAVYAPS